MASVISSGRSAAGANETGSTASVLEFVCLFTHDLKRKQKRWQDGRLKYHTFNRRVMVYDDRGNYVGDMHWRHDWDFDEGEEIQLERGGVIVQVAECVARQQQDLSELIDKRAKEKEQRQAAIASRPARPTPAHTPLRVVPRNTAQQDHFQTRHRPLNQLLGTPTGHHGRALVPNESPFEQRHGLDESNDGADSSRASKRRRYEDTLPSKMGYAQSLFGAPLTLSGAPASSAPLRRPAVAKVQDRREPSPPREVVSRQQDERIAPTRTRNTTGPNRMTTQRVENVSRPITAAKRNASPPQESLFVSQDDNSDSVEGTIIQGTHKHHAESMNTRPYGSSSFFTGSITTERTYTSKPSQVATARGTLLSTVRKNSALPNKNLGSNPARPCLGSSKQDEQSIVLDDDGADEDDDNIEHGRKQRRGASPAPISVDGRSSKRAAPVPEETQANKRKKTTSVRKPTTDKSARRNQPKESDPVTLDEPTAELRIKSRQKRGLLVLSEKPKRAKRSAKGTSAELVIEAATKSISVGPVGKNDTCDAIRQDACPDVQNSEDEDPGASPMLVIDTGPARKDRSRDRGQPEVSSTTFPREQMVANQDRVGPNDSAVTDTRASLAMNKIQTKYESSRVDPESDSEPTSRRSHIHQRRENVHRKDSNATKSLESSKPKAEAPIEVESEREDEEISRYPRRRRTIRKPALPEFSDESKGDEPESAAEITDEELPQVPVGPRLAKLARKSIKSREVIGFVPSSSPVITIHKQVEPVHIHPVVETPLVTEERPTSHGPNTKDVVTPQSLEAPMAEHCTERAEKHKSMSPRSVREEDVETASLEQPKGIPEQSSRAATSSNNHKTVPENDLAAPLMEQQASGSEPTDHSSRAVNRQNDKVSADIAVPATVPNHEPQPDQDIKELPSPAPEPASHSDGSGTKEPQTRSDPTMLPLHKPPAKDKCQTDIAVGVPVPPDGPAKTIPPRTVPLVDNSSKPGTPVRIVNPATRGRKAALKSHAAGQVPQSILPNEPPPLRTREVLRRETAVSGAEERPKRKMTFPGFTSARAGGPWSREAHDLLETGRPA